MKPQPQYRCEQCGKLFGLKPSERARHYCGAACRKAAYRYRRKLKEAQAI